MIDCGLLKCTKIGQDLFRPKDFASDLLVLRLASHDTVAKILSLESSDPQSQITISLSLYFMRVHLACINMKGRLKPKERISMLWSTFLYILHIDGVSILTKRNWASECISLSFLIMVSDVRYPHRLTSEPSEHSIAIMQNLCREFTVNDLISVIQKLLRFHTAIANGNLSLQRSKNGYVATAHHDSMKKQVEMHIGEVVIETDLAVIEAQQGISDDNLASLIWNSRLKKIFNSTQATMKKFLINTLGVREFHPFLNEFVEADGVDIMAKRLQDLVDNTDDIFKKETGLAEDDIALTSDIVNECPNNNDRDSGKLSGTLVHSNEYIGSLIEDIIKTANDNRCGDEDQMENINTEPSLFEDLFENTGNHNLNEEEDRSIHRSFLRVITSLMNVLQENPMVLLTSLGKMHLPGREHGSITSAQKCKSLLQRWFGKKKIEIIEKERTLERGSIIAFDKSDSSTKYIITAVFKVDGKKWHMSPMNDNPAWPVEEKEIKKYQVAIREVHVEDVESMHVRIKEYETMEDGKNVRSTYRFVKDISDIKANLFKVNL